ncbi:MAG: hypothetical protein QOK44_761 [Betaproteobacteria bacterium]|nr:hypothetical protein [Betaproteobacteria bacterium]
METYRGAYVSLAFAVAVLVAPAAWAQSHGSHIAVAPQDLKWAAVPSLPPGAQISVIEGPMNKSVPFTVRIKFPANYRLPAHWHNNIEHITVLSGTLHMGIGDKFDATKTTPLAPGWVSIMQPATNHFAWTKEETIAQVHGMGPWEVTYVNPADDPRKK